MADKNTSYRRLPVVPLIWCRASDTNLNRKIHDTASNGVSGYEDSYDDTYILWIAGVSHVGHTYEHN